VEKEQGGALFRVAGGRKRSRKRDGKPGAAGVTNLGDDRSALLERREKIVVAFGWRSEAARRQEAFREDARSQKRARSIEQPARREPGEGTEAAAPSP
jgi:hypothetical protein